VDENIVYVVMNLLSVIIICFYVVTSGEKQNRQHICVLLGSTSIGYGYYRWKLLGLTSVGSEHSRRKLRP
jgi:hypothetical protein